MDYCFVDTDYSARARKARIIKKILWIAKKQRILLCLEDAYPCILSVQEILQRTRSDGGEAGTVVMMMKELEKSRHVKEVEVGRWIRLQYETQNGSGHELKLVREIPHMTGKEQPTIAVVTSLFCEKLAVDAMIKEKITYVKYKTEVESQVYTVGEIGRFKVVSTKLSKHPTSSHAARISAENTVTRLLGIFNKVEHVLLVGVSGGVHNENNAATHVRPGDVVVSMTTDKPMYVHCAKVGRGQDGEFTYKVRPFVSKNKMLQNVALSLDSIVRSEWKRVKPWEIYLEEGLEMLEHQEINFQRPKSDKDLRQIYQSNDSVASFAHPVSVCEQEIRVNTPVVRHGSIGSGKLVTRVQAVRKHFSDRCGVCAFDFDFEAVLESLEGNRNESFLVIRGICDYIDGTVKDWQPYSALAAASYMKALIMAL